MQDTFVSSMQPGQHQHLRLEFWNGAGCVLQDTTVPVVSQMKQIAQRELTGEIPWFSYFSSCLLINKLFVATVGLLLHKYLIILWASHATYRGA